MRGVTSDVAATSAGLDAGRVKEKLGLPDECDPWLEELAAIGPPVRPPAQPSGVPAFKELTRLGCERHDVAAAALAAPSPDETPELWWLLERCYQRLAGD